MDVNAANSINSMKVDWEGIEGLDLLKARNEKPEALNIIIATYFRLDDMIDCDSLRLSKGKSFKYLDVVFNDVKASIISLWRRKSCQSGKAQNSQRNDQEEI